MKLLVELEEYGDITAETVRQNVEEAIKLFKEKQGLSGPHDEGYINLVEVTIIPE